MHIKSQTDFYSGVMFAAIGTAFAIGASTYNVGSSARMGAGYFPLMLGIVLALLGTVMLARSLALTVDTVDGSPIGQWAWKQTACIIAANLAFGVLLGGLPSIGLPAMGMIIAIYASTLIASLAGHAFDLKKALMLATVLATGSYVAFIWALKLQIQVWPTLILG